MHRKIVPRRSFTNQKRGMRCSIELQYRQLWPLLGTFELFSANSGVCWLSVTWHWNVRARSRKKSSSASNVSAAVMPVGYTYERKAARDPVISATLWIKIRVRATFRWESKVFSSTFYFSVVLSRLSSFSSHDATAVAWEGDCWALAANSMLCLGNESRLVHLLAL